MKYLLILFAIPLLFVSFVSCDKGITEPVESQIMTEVYTLPYYQHYDPDTQFFSANPIDTVGILREVKFYAYNFVDITDDGRPGIPVHFGFFISQNYDNRFSDSDTLYFSPDLSTENNTEFIVTLNEKFDGPINVHIQRYETYKPVDFRCEVLYSVKN